MKVRLYRELVREGFTFSHPHRPIQTYDYSVVQWFSTNTVDGLGKIISLCNNILYATYTDGIVLGKHEGTEKHIISLNVETKTIVAFARVSQPLIEKITEIRRRLK